MRISSVLLITALLALTHQAVATISSSSSIVTSSSTSAEWSWYYDSSFDCSVTAVSAKVWTWSPFYAPLDVRAAEVAVFEIDFSSELYLDTSKLSSFTMNHMELSDTLTLQYGDVGAYLANSLRLTCKDITFAATGSDSFITVLPGVVNPLSIVYGWQFDSTTTFDPSKIVIVLPLGEFEQTSGGFPEWHTFWKFTEQDLLSCQVDFNPSYISDNVDCLLPITEFSRKESADCVPTDLDEAYTEILSDIKSFGSQVHQWLYNNDYSFDFAIPLAVAAASSGYFGYWTACEEVMQDVLAFDYEAATQVWSDCVETRRVVNSTCMMEFADLDYCEYQNEDYYADACCHHDNYQDSCCADTTITFEYAANYDDANTSVCSRETVVSVLLEDLMHDFDTVFEDDYLQDAYLAESSYETFASLQRTCYLDFIQNPEECDSTTTCFSGDCKGGLCEINFRDGSFDTAVLMCVVYTALDAVKKELDGYELLELFVDYLNDTYISTTSTDLLVQTQEVVDSLTQSVCVLYDGYEELDSSSVDFSSEYSFDVTHKASDYSNSYYDDDWAFSSELSYSDLFDWMEHLDDSSSLDLPSPFDYLTSTAKGFYDYTCSMIPPPGWSDESLYLMLVSAYGVELADAICPYEWVDVKSDVCLAAKYCNWYPYLSDDADETPCEQLFYNQSGACVGDYTLLVGEPLGCFLLVDHSESTCTSLDGHWNDFFGTCQLTTATDKGSCYDDHDFFKYGTNTFTAALSEETFCILTAATVATCKTASGTWVATLGFCYDGSNATTCATNTDNIWYQGRQWRERYATEDLCYADTCSNGDSTLSKAECEATGECDLSCHHCITTTADFAPLAGRCIGGKGAGNITQANCPTYAGAIWDTALGCLLPAENEAECTDMHGDWYQCSSLSVSECTDQKYGTEVVLDCTVQVGKCHTQEECEAAWVCLGEGESREYFDFCLVDCAFNTDGSLKANYVYSRVVPNACINTSKTEDTCTSGAWIPRPSTYGECNQLLNTEQACFKDDGTITAEFANCATCGSLGYFYFAVNGTWEALEMQPYYYFGREWVTPGMVSGNDVVDVIDEADTARLQYGFEEYLVSFALKSYASQVMENESLPLLLVGCDCQATNYTAEPLCSQDIEYDTWVFTVDGTAENITMAPFYTGGSQVQFRLPAGLPTNLTITVSVKPILDFISKRLAADSVELPLEVEGLGQVGDLVGDGFTVAFNQQLSKTQAIEMCISKPSFIQTPDSSYDTPDMAEYSSSLNEFTVLELTSTYVAPNTCSDVTDSATYFPIKRLKDWNPSSDGGNDNKKLAALAVLVLLILVPVVVVAAIFALRHKGCKKALRRVAPK